MQHAAEKETERQKSLASAAEQKAKEMERRWRQSEKIRKEQAEVVTEMNRQIHVVQKQVVALNKRK